ncbi:trans-Golgi network integral membrane protein TGN38-like isoform X2 [Tribolium madens]|uniref:trans-Golgi network integral membrane protein TGN38-like isoform X2 n=1 Tax=Tribolium madens TaxID=41895 RepID=UPI001CF72B07|nr:trans-Golgi network integral membrane protein TGN38-like isoform X2 [Tribolium madens]
MNKIHAIYLFLGLYSVTGAPVEKSMYDAIQEKCPSVSSILSFKTQPLFKICKDWKNISEISKLTEANAAKIRCLLYYQAFTKYCTQTQIVNTTVSRELEYDLDTMCEYIKSMPHKNLSTIFANRNNCETICTDELELPHSVCKISYYFAHLDVNKPPEDPSKTDNIVQQSQITQDKLQSGNSLPNPAPANSAVDPGISEDKALNKTTQKTTSQKDIAPADTQPQHENPSSKQAETPNSESLQDKVLSQTAQNPQADQTRVENQNSVSIDIKKVKAIVPNPPQEAKKVETVKPNPPPETKKVDAVEANPANQQDLQQEDKMPDDDDEDEQPPDQQSNLNAGRVSKPSKLDESEPVNYSSEMENDSYFFTYFMVLCVIFIAGYVCYHNKQKILALILEGRRGKRQYRGRRPNSANYHKLDSNLEEAISSSCKKNTSNVIY